MNNQTIRHQKGQTVKILSGSFEGKLAEIIEINLDTDRARVSLHEDACTVGEPDLYWFPVERLYIVTEPEQEETSALDSQVAGSHYKDMAIGPTEYSHKNKLGACETLAIRYISRHKKKNGRQDIDKAIHCLEMLKEMDYPE